MVSSFLEQSRALPFKYRTDEIVYAQRDVLHNPSMYVVNRKSLIVNKPHVFYNDDSQEVHCLPLARNALKWSEGFLGDCMTHALQCRYEEPMRKIALNMDSAKVGLFERDGSYYTTTPTPIYQAFNPKTKRHKRLFRFSDKVSPKVSWCLRHLCPKDEPFDHYELKRKPIISTKRHAWNTGHDCVDWVQVSEHDWLNIENLSVEMKSGQLFSIRGALGACHDTPVNKHDVDYLITRLHLNRHCTSDELSVDNFVYHHSGSVVKHHMRHGDIVFPIYPRNLERGLLDKCPSIVVEDHI